MSTLDSRSTERPTVMVGEKLSRAGLPWSPEGLRGIGAAICHSLASQGAAVAAGYSGNRERAEQFVKDFERDIPDHARATPHRGERFSAGGLPPCGRGGAGGSTAGWTSW